MDRCSSLDTIYLLTSRLVNLEKCLYMCMSLRVTRDAGAGYLHTMAIINQSVYIPLAMTYQVQTLMLL